MDKLKRIKGIISARQGAEIPKFQTGARFAKQKGDSVIYSNNKTSWFKDLGLTMPHLGSLDGFVDISTPDLQKPYEIPGDPKITPNTAIDNSANRMARVESAREQSQIQKEINASPTTPVKTAEVTRSTSVNGQPNVNPQINKSPSSVLLPDIVDTPESKQSSKINTIKAQNEDVQEEIYVQQENASNSNKLRNIIYKNSGSLGDVFESFGSSEDSDTTKMANAIYDNISSTAANFGPWGMAVSAIMNAAKDTGEILQSFGGGTDQVTTLDQWMDSAFLSPSIGWINGFWGENSNEFSVDSKLYDKVGGSYGGSYNLAVEAAKNADKKYGLFSEKDRNKTNKAIARANADQKIIRSIDKLATDQRDAVASMGDQAGLAYSAMIDGGYNQKYTYAAKQGGLLKPKSMETIEWEPQIELNWELPEFKEGGSIDLVEELEWIPELKEGGTIKDSDIPETEETTQKNVIPEGALHKNKHHMEHAEGLTKKGIPVVDDDGEQQAEIEHSEIIFTLEVTKKLEEYYEIFYSESSSDKEKDQAALDAGKLLVYQILENTEDRTGLIDSCKNGGTLTLKKSVDDVIQETLKDLHIQESHKNEATNKKEDKTKVGKQIIKEALKEVIIELFEL